jgi:hypothetical protein
MQPMGYHVRHMVAEQNLAHEVPYWHCEMADTQEKNWQTHACQLLKVDVH